MAEKRAGGPPQENPPTTTHPAQEVRTFGSSENGSSRDTDSLVPGEKRYGMCPGLCGSEFDVRWTRDGFLIGSFSSGCPGKGECVRSLAAAASEYWGDPLNGGHILHDPLRWLAPWLSAAGRKGAVTREPEQLPAEEVIRYWHERLMTDPKLKTARQHLGRARGLTGDTLRRYEIGYGSFHGRPPAFMHPVRNEQGELVNLIESYWPRLWRSPSGKLEKARTLAGRAPALYPAQALAPRRGPLGVLVVSEGRWKTLALNQVGFRAVTSTNGTYWNPDWTPRLAGQLVAVIYDCDAEHVARQRAEEFRAAGVDAWPVLLSARGFAGKDGVDDALGRGWTAEQLRRYINRCRDLYRRVA